MLWGFGAELRYAQGLIWGGIASRMPPYFLCFAKESRQRKATRDARLSAAFGVGGPLCFSPARAVPETRVSCAAAQTTGPDFPRAGCDARRALRDGTPAKRDGQQTYPQGEIIHRR